MPVKARDVLKSLERKGFSQSESDHSFMILYVNGKKTPIRTRISHGSDEISENLIHLMSRQLWLDKRKFLNLIDCPLTLTEYLKELEEQGFNFT